jgi:hypothetical protein
MGMHDPDERNARPSSELNVKEMEIPTFNSNTQKTVRDKSHRIGSGQGIDFSRCAFEERVTSARPKVK